MSNIPLFEYAPTLIKQIVAGKGNASKQEIEEKVPIFLQKLPIGVDIKKDAADALAIALCHAITPNIF